ncbi:hypothetical protein D3C73_768650 [compost metagenome]
MIGFDLTQEVLATTLRIENRINQLSGNEFKSWEAKLEAIAQGFESGAYEARSFATPSISSHLSAPEVSEKLLVSYFKNPKHFFEGEGKSKLRTELEAKLIQPVAALMEQQAQELERAYLEQLDVWLEDLKGTLDAGLDEHIGGLLDALEMKVDINELMNKQQQLQALL